MMLPLVAYSAVEIDGLYYDLDTTTETAKVSRNGSGTYYGRTEILIPSSVNYNGVDYIVRGIGAWAFDNAVHLTNITIPETVTYIEESAFYNCSSLTALNIPSKVHSIYDNAFQGCSKLAAILIPKSVTYIGNGLFQNCDGLESIVVEEGNPKYDSRNNCNAIIWETRLMHGCKNTIIPDGVTMIWPSAFMYCKGLISIDFPNGITTIGTNAFYMCRDLHSVTLSSGLETIQRAAFAECYSLESVTLPSSVTTIEMYAFGNCKLRTVTSFINDPFAISNDVFGVSEDAVLYVPKGTKSKYESTTGWNKFNSIVEITQKCKTPTISYSNGQLKFECETDGVNFKTKITDIDIRDYSASVIDLSATYNISVYATKTGYDNSDVASATLCWIDTDPKTEGIENGVAQMRAKAVLIQSNNGILNIDGVNNDTDIAVYSSSGMKVGSVKSSGSSTYIATNLRRGEIAIVKIGDKSVKVVMK